MLLDIFIFAEEGNSCSQNVQYLFLTSVNSFYRNHPLHTCMCVYTYITMLLLDLEEDLQSAEARCNLLEKQLDYMRKMVQTAETDRDTAIQRSAMVAKQAAQQTSDEIRGQLEKLSGLERDHMKLTASHSIAEVSVSCSVHCPISISQLQIRIKEHDPVMSYGKS